MSMRTPWHRKGVALAMLRTLLHSLPHTASELSHQLLEAMGPPRADLSAERLGLGLVPPLVGDA